VLLKQGAALTFGHPAPDAELDAVIQGIGTAFGDHRAVPANHSGFALCGTAHEKLVGIGRATQPLRDPGDPGFPGRHLK